jgi:predicted O-linked N-acetylglucosamine transferase (SPINDLY family)
VTERAKKAADIWRETIALSDRALAEQIQRDRIDILIDLTMHMQDNRMRLLAGKPAPIQVSWLAYPGSSGLETMDYRLTDATIDPIGQDESWSSEKPLRLADCWCCYEPIGPSPETNDLPALATGQVTFSCLNNFCKVNGELLALWAKLMVHVPNSRLMILAPQGQHRQRTLLKLREHGVESVRVDFVANLPRPKYLEQYHRVDVALDPFPYNGVTTTCDALWMGVPVLTLPGKWPASRVGQSLLRATGLPELVAHSEADFLRLAADVVGDLPRLAHLRAGLRDRMKSSPLMDAKRFALQVEAAYRQIWRGWCGG